MDVYAHAFEVQHKDDRSPLTEADLAAHRPDVAHGPVIGGGEQEGDARLIQRTRLLGGRGVQIDAQRG